MSEIKRSAAHLLHGLVVIQHAPVVLAMIADGLLIFNRELAQLLKKLLMMDNVLKQNGVLLSLVSTKNIIAQFEQIIQQGLFLGPRSKFNKKTKPQKNKKTKT